MTTDYQDFLKAVALRFILRHQCEHLGHEDTLWYRAMQHLVLSCDADAMLAGKAASLALVEASTVPNRQQMDLAKSSASHSLIVDPETGEAWAIPVALIYERIACGPDGSRFRVANP